MQVATLEVLSRENGKRLDASEIAKILKVQRINSVRYALKKLVKFGSFGVKFEDRYVERSHGRRRRFYWCEKQGE